MKSKTKNLSRDTIQVLQLVIKQLQRQPERYDQNQPGILCTVHNCKSPACVIGWFKMFNRERHYTRQGHLDPLFYDRLYWSSRWPVKFGGRADCLCDCVEPSPTVEIAIKRIKHFIRTDGRE